MQKIHFSWSGSQESEEGCARYSLDETESGILLHIALPSFKQANAIYNALNTAMEAGYYNGVRDSEVVAKNAIRSMLG